MATFGDNLKRERESRHISLAAIAAATKISVRQLQAIEEEDFRRLPGGIFNRSFVRAYARQVGLDEDRIVNQFLAAAGETPDPELDAEPVRTMPRAPLSANAVVAILLLFVFALAAWGGWRLYRDRTRSSSSPDTGNVAATATPPETAPAPTTPAPTPNPGASPDSKSLSPATTGPLHLEINLSSSAWVKVMADDHEVFARVLPAGTQQQVAAQHSLRLTTGNAGVTHLVFNHQPVPALGAVGEIGHFAYPRPVRVAPAHVAHQAPKPALSPDRSVFPAPPASEPAPPPR